MTNDADPKKAKLLIRADASTAIGAGHVVRCLALAQGWQDVGGEVCFVIAEGGEAFGEVLQAERIRTHRINATPGGTDDARETIRLAQEEDAAWVVVDGYHLGASYRREFVAEALHLVVLDDNGEQKQYVAEIIINYNLHADETMYADRPPKTRLLLGPRYTLLRRQFAEGCGLEREFPAAAGKILVALGGGDENNVTGKVLGAIGLLGRADLDVRVILGGANPHAQSLRDMAVELPCKVRFERNVSDMAGRMAWADLGITGAGGTCRESACMSLPAVLLCLADNQRHVAEEHARHGAVVNLGDAATATAETIARTVETLLDDAPRREAMGRAGKNLADGRGAARVVSVLRGQLLKLHPATGDDARLLWNWANDPKVRERAFSSNPISWKDHVQWFQQKLDSPDTRIYIGVDEQDSPVGQIRFDRIADDEAEIDVSIDARQRGSGLGSWLLDMGVRTYFRKTGATRVHGFVKPDNPSSIRIFEKADFVRRDMEKKSGTQVLHFVRDNTFKEEHVGNK